MSKEMMYKKYHSLCQDFLSIAESFISNDVLNQLKNNYAHDIDSKRKLSMARDLKTFLRLLEKRNIISCDNIKQLWHISKTCIGNPELECKLMEYEDWLQQTAPPLSFYNMYQSDYTSSQKQESLVENQTVLEQHGASSSICNQSSVPNLITSLNNIIQESCCPKQVKRENDREESLRQAVMLQVSERLGRSWRDVARHLGIRECEIDATQNKYPYNLKEQSHEILKIYMLQTNRERWAINLIHALEKARRRDLKEFVEGLILSNRDIYIH